MIPVYNRQIYIGAALDSLLAQTFTDYEIVVVDDGSTDASRDRVRAYADPRIRLLCHERNRGISASRNRGIAAANGEYVAFLDSDDEATPQRLSRQVAFLDAHPDHAGVGAWMRWIDASGRAIGGVKRKATASTQIAAERLFRACLENTTAMARTAVLRAHPHREYLALSEDHDLWSRIADTHKLAALPSALVYRRRHRQQITLQRHDEIKACRLRVFAAQLQRLGIVFQATDVERHYLLRRMHKLGFKPDMAFVDWTERWLLGLQAANRMNQTYPEPAFTAVLATFWGKTCWHALAQNRLRVLKRFAASPLRGGIAAGLRAESETRLRPGV